MDNKIWRDKSQRLEVNVGFVRIGYISYINYDGERIPQLNSMKVYSYNCDSEAEWEIFCLENKIQKWCYLKDIINL